jgi:hypothetical protein
MLAFQLESCPAIMKLGSFAFSKIGIHFILGMLLFRIVCYHVLKLVVGACSPVPISWPVRAPVQEREPQPGAVPAGPSEAGAARRQPVRGADGHSEATRTCEQPLRAASPPTGLASSTLQSVPPMAASQSGSSLSSL